MRVLHVPEPFPRPAVGGPQQWRRQSRDLARDRRFQRIGHGVWVHTSQDLAPVHRAALLQLRLGADTAVSQLSACLMHGMPLGTTPFWVHGVLGTEPAPRSAELPAEVRRPHLAWEGRRVKSTQPGLHIHRGLGLARGTGLWGCAVVDPVEALLAAHAHLSPWRLTACLDHLMAHDLMIGRTHRRALDPAGITERLEAVGGHGRAVSTLRHALGLAVPRVWSPMETLLRMLVLGRGLPAPVPNLTVRLGDGGPRYELDLAWEESRTALEYNGAVHYRDRVAYADEMHRLQLLADAGWGVRVLVLEDLRQPRRREAWLDWLRRRLG